MEKAGHDVTGLDFDAYMLEKIEEKITDEKITWHKADVIRDNWGTEHCLFRHWRQGD